MDPVMINDVAQVHTNKEVADTKSGLEINATRESPQRTVRKTLVMTPITPTSVHQGIILATSFNVDSATL